MKNIRHLAKLGTDGFSLVSFGTKYTILVVNIYEYENVAE